MTLRCVFVGRLGGWKGVITSIIDLNNDMKWIYLMYQGENERSILRNILNYCLISSNSSST